MLSAPSVVGVVTSIDEKCGRWPASVRCKESRKEMVSELEGMIVQRLRVQHTDVENRCFYGSREAASEESRNKESSDSGTTEIVRRIH